MALSLDFVPQKPFDEFKWKWASLQCTEDLNVVNLDFVRWRWENYNGV